MKKVRLGRSEIEVPRVSAGTWGHGGPRTVGRHPVGWTGYDDRTATEALLLAYENGLTHWDTADVYGDGHAERLIGALWDRIDREQVFLASKVGWDPGPYGHYYHPKQIVSQLERSLTNLRTDRLDLYYFHHCEFGPRGVYLDDALALLRHLQTDGKIRFIGLSDWKPGRVATFADRVQPDVVQPYRNVLDDDYASSGLKTWVEANDAGVAFFSPLKHGLLLGKHESPPRFGPGDHRSRVRGFRDPSLLAHLRRCRELVEHRYSWHPQPVLHALIGVLLADSPSACVLVGLRTPDHVHAALTVGEPLSPTEAEWVRDLYRTY